MMKKLLAGIACVMMMAGCAANTPAKDNDALPKNEEVTSDTPADINPDSVTQVEADGENAITVKEALKNQKKYVEAGNEVKIEGYLPQAARVDDAGNSFMDIQESPDSKTEDEWIRLQAENLDFGGCKAVLTGTLFYNDANQLTLAVSKAQEITE